PPCQDGGAIDDEIAPADEAPMARQADQHDEQALAGWGIRLGRAGTAGRRWAHTAGRARQRAAHTPRPAAARPPASHAGPATTAATACAAAPAATVTPPASGVAARPDRRAALA